MGGLVSSMTGGSSNKRRRLEETVAPDPLDALFAAVKADDVETLTGLADQGVDVAAFKDDMTALLWAAESGAVGAVKTLVERGADVNGARGVDNCTPLMRAVMHNHLEVVEVLLGVAACDPNVAKTDDGMSALLIAATKGGLTMIKLLLQRGADPEQRNFTDNGQDAMTVAEDCGNFEAANLLREYVVDRDKVMAVVQIDKVATFGETAVFEVHDASPGRVSSR
jgi:ankyrin repeat protein